ncbi:MAG: glycoside hydrolase family 36 protein, partial [Bacteroidota bacterium]
IRVTMPLKPNIKLLFKPAGLTVRLSETFVLTDIVPVIETEGHTWSADGPECRASVEGAVVVYQFPECRLELTFSSLDEETLLLDALVRNTSNRDLRIRSVAPFRTRNDWGSEGLFNVDAGARVMTYPAERAYGFSGPQRIDGNQPHTSFWFAGFSDVRSRQNFFVGPADIPAGMIRHNIHPLMSHTPGRRVLRWECSFDCRAGSRGVRLVPGASIRPGSLHISRWEGGYEAGLDRYGEYLGQKFGRKRSEHPPVGWCSWYAGYFSDITEEEVLKNLGHTALIPELKYFQIDDGWESKVGTATAGMPEYDSLKFPHGMKWLADAIRAKGVKPGLWIRPFKGWGESAGIPNWARGATLDISHPEARVWLSQLTRRLVREWGYEYLKFDFVTYDLFGKWGMELAENPGRLGGVADDTITNITAYRLALEAIREGAGEECFLLGCNCLLAPAFGIVDGMRIGDDVSAAHWERTVLMGAKSVAPLRFLNGNVWWNDPDCMMAQEPMSLSEVRLWNTFVSFTGGLPIVSSKLFELLAERPALLVRTLPVRHHKARPLDSDEEIPPVWSYRVRQDGREIVVVGFFNWGDSEREFVIDPAAVGCPEGEVVVQEFWGKREWIVSDRMLRATVPARDCLVVTLKDHQEASLSF